MMFALRLLLTPWLVLLLAARLLAADPSPAPPAAKPAGKPIRALLITGGCCHDYARQKLILTRGISARANVVWTIAHQGGSATDSRIPLYEDPNWAQGFDVIVHNECFANVKDEAWVERILKPHREGVPAVLIHCAMHCYRTGTDKWFEFVGMQSPGHGPHYGYTVENLQPDHPIMAGFGESWAVAKGELYHSIKLFPSATALAHAKRKSDNQPQICVWTNQYHKARVFATTIGHYNETMAEPQYLDFVTRGLLWSVDRLREGEFSKTDDKTDAAIKELIQAKVETTGGAAAPSPDAKCCGAGNLAFEKPTKASTEETAKNNFARHANDGNLNTRWCANSPASDNWWQVDLGELQTVKAVRIHWEGNAAYRYIVEGSADGETWKLLVDRKENTKVERVPGHAVDAPNTRFLKVTYFGSSTRAWASFYEFEAYADKLPELPPGVGAKEPAPGGGPAASIADVQAPPEFNVTLFGAPPAVNYPVCLAAAPTGEVFVGVDEQGSLGKEKGRGKVLRCVDTDGDGQADKIGVFAAMDHPRGLIYDAGQLWVLHPPYLTLYHDDNLDGVADRSEVLVTGLSTDQVARRGADHTTNGIRMGIDGWIYIAVGDFGFVNATGADGRTLSRRGGGVVRVRPDGTELEVYSWGQRNILDACIDPYLNIFTRDNTNDGGGWNIRTTHVLQTADYGYPSRYLNFAEETAPPLADYGGGSGCGGMFFHDLRWPLPFGDAAYTCDWGRSEVLRHNLPAAGATFAPHQEVFLKIPRPTDIDADGSGRMYVASWKNGGFNFSGPNVGFVAMVTPRDFVPKPFPQLDKLSAAELVALHGAPSAVHRLAAQREILRRGARQAEARGDLAQALQAFATAQEHPRYGRVAAIFTLKQLLGADANPALVELSAVGELREFALRALTDRASQLANVPLEPIASGLQDADPRVVAQAIVSLGRLGKSEAAELLVAFTTRASNGAAPAAQPLHAQADPGRVIPHLAVQALIALKGIDACLRALDGPHRSGALMALRQIHEEATVAGVIAKLATTRDVAGRQELLATLARLYYREGDYTNGDWWGTRPDNVGPYYDRQTWSGSPRIAAVLLAAQADADEPTAKFLAEQASRFKLKIEGLATTVSARAAEPMVAIVPPAFDANNPNQIGNLTFEFAAERTLAEQGDAERGKRLFSQQSCIACHTTADGQTPKGPHLVDIGKRYKRFELIESILKPSAKLAQGFESWRFETEAGKLYSGFVVSESAESVTIRQGNGLSVELPRDAIVDRKKEELSIMPNGLAANLTPSQLADLIAYLESLKSAP